MEKIDSKLGHQNNPNLQLWGHRVRILRFGSVLEQGEFLMNFDWHKVGPLNQTIRKKRSA